MGSCNMFLLKPTIFAIFAVLVSVQADQSWFSFRTTFALHGFPDRQPWLQSEAEDRGRFLTIVLKELVSQVFVMFHPEKTLKWLSSMMSMGSLPVCNLLLPRNSFKDHMISLDPTGTVQIMSWVKMCTLQQLTSLTLPAFAKVDAIKLLSTLKELVTVFGSKMVQRSKICMWRL